MKITKREIWILHKLLDHDIARYLMANSCQRIDSDEKADQHIRMSKTLASFAMAKKTTDVRRIHDAELNSWSSVHKFLARTLTDRLDEVIEFPLDTPLYGSDYDQYHVRFFQVIVDHIGEIEEIVFKTWSGDDD